MTYEYRVTGNTAERFRSLSEAIKHIEYEISTEGNYPHIRWKWMIYRRKECSGKWRPYKIYNRVKVISDVVA